MFRDPAPGHVRAGQTPGEDAVSAPGGAPLPDAAWPRLLAPYREPLPGRSLLELLLSALPFVGLWALIAVGVHHGLWAALLLAVPAAGFLVRLFMIQHDCGHGSFFRGRTANDLVGRVLGVLTLTPYAYWRRCHAMHHAGAANLDRRGIGDITTLTLSEYLDLPRRRRLAYRLLRNPFVLLLLAPAFLFIIKHRLPIELIDGGREVWISTMATNFALLTMFGALGALIGFGDLLLVQLPITLLASSIGVALFFVQHQFEHTWWARSGRWHFATAALAGSSHLDLPAPLRWLTLNIGIHHVHHLAARIPSYRLPEVLRDHPELRARGRLTWRDTLACFRLALWDEANQRLISFREARRMGTGTN